MLPMYEVPVCTIHSVEKVGGASSRGQHSYRVDAVCKDLRTLRFAFQHDGHSRRKLHDKLLAAAFTSPSHKHEFFAFKHTPDSAASDSEPTGDIFDMNAELRRIGLPCEGWRVSDINRTYRLCASYPRQLAVPSKISDKDLQFVARFRSRQRIPILSWLHPRTRASLTRSAQPLVGLRGGRSHDDEAYVQEIANANPNAHRLVVMDARPKINALANKARGGGYEVDSRYSDADPIFLDIANIHVMRDSLRKVRDLCFPTTDNAHWLTNLEKTQWLEHIRLILAGAVEIVDHMDRQRTSVMLHCSDGWDRTSQLGSLAMLLMDPYHRTIDGFEVLIEKEWLAVGHKFAQRCGHGDGRAHDDQRSPIFLQFIDAVWQVARQFPAALEFNEEFLLAILDNLYSCRFGTFLANSDRERSDLRERSLSLWDFLNRHRDDYRNPLFREDDAVLFPVAAAHGVQLWTGYYARWNPSAQPRSGVAQLTNNGTEAAHLQPNGAPPIE